VFSIVATRRVLELRVPADVAGGLGRVAVRGQLLDDRHHLGPTPWLPTWEEWTDRCCF
jgi:hypothetical protein